MIEAFGMSLGTPFQGITLLGMFALALVWWVRGAPDRLRAKNDGDGSLRSDLLKRINALEEQQVADRHVHAAQREADRKACQEETDELRKQIREQDKLIDGLQRQLIMFQVATGRALPLGSNSPEIEHMIAQLMPIYGTPKDKSETLKAAEETLHAADLTVEQVKQDEATKPE